MAKWTGRGWEDDLPRDLELYKVYHHLEQKMDDAVYQYHCRMNLQILVPDRAKVVSELLQRGYEVLKFDHRFKFLRNGDKLAISKEAKWNDVYDTGVELFVLHVSKGTPEYNQILWLAEQDDFGDDGIWWKNN